MTYSIVCIMRNRDDGWRYYVVIHCKRSDYVGERGYATHKGAMRAARSTGLPPKESTT